MSLAAVPARGVLVRRKRNSSLYRVGEVRKGGWVGNVYHDGEVVQLHPQWDGRTHSKTIARFLGEYEVCTE